jgi:nicotinamidase-related amidase
MTAPLSFDPARSAVLSMDLQTGIVSAYAKEPQAFVARAAGVLRHARELGMCVIHVQFGFRPNMPEVTLRNALVGAIKNSARHQEFFQGPSGAIHPGVAPEGDDIVVTKHRVNAFVGTDLELILRAKEMDTLILFGIATSGVVLYTLLHAADADYRLVVLKDCCADRDEETHACLVDKIFTRQATVVDAADFLMVSKP